MFIPRRAALRLALTGWLGLASFLAPAVALRAAESADKVLPNTTVVYVAINNAAALRDAFRQSQMGQLWADPALKPFKDDVVEKLQDANKSAKETLGLSIRELFELPQGPVSLALVGKDNAETPAALVMTLDAGKNAEKFEDVLTKAMKRGEEEGAKVAKEEFKGLTIHVIQPPKDKDAKEGDKAPPAVWTHDGARFTFSTDVDVVKDLLAHASGRSDSLASNENYAGAMKKLGVDHQIVWFADMNKLLTLLAKAGAQGKNADAFRQVETFAQVLGINGLKAAAGTVAMNSGPYDTVTKTLIVAPAPLQGLLKVLAFPKVSLKPEPWVPATVAGYQSWSWDLDATFTAINDLANMFQPGVLNVLEQQLVGPNGGEPLNFKKDVFDPLGDRITLISDFKKPITEDSQRMLIGVALEDQKAFQSTLDKLVALAGGAPKKREFQGVTIQDFEMPNLPNNPNGGNQIKGPISVAITKNTLFISTEQTLLEQVIRGGAASLAESTAYQAVAKEIPASVSSLTYTRPEESARLTYDMLKNGQFEKALAQGAAAGGGALDLSKQFGKIFDKDKLPDFAVFAKYLSAGGGYSVMDDDGLSMTSFSLRKANP